MMDLAAAVPPTAEERARRCREYLEALEEERRKIQVFQRELPLSLHLVTQAIENYRQQMAAEMLAAGCAVRSELEEEAEEMSGEGAPVLEEFIPIKRGSSSEADEEEEVADRRQGNHQQSSNGGHNDEDSSNDSREKQQETSSEKRPDWLRSVQLWSQHPDPQPLPGEEEHAAVEINPPRPSVPLEGKKATGAFHPFHPQKRSPPPPRAPAPVEAAPVPASAPAVPATSSTSDTRGGGGGGSGGRCGGKSGSSGVDEKDGQPHRKNRRCWSPELHRRFLSALQQLGGSDVATPKRIRELMTVDGLTNDEVKSHLQKYRLHSRRPSPTSHANAGSPPPQQVVFVGGIWVPPPEYAAAAAVAAAAAARPSTSEGIPPGPPSGIYAPIASVPAPKHRQQQQKQVKQQPQRSPGGRGEQCVADDGATRSHSPATSSSSRTTTTSGWPRRGR